MKSRNRASLEVRLRARLAPLCYLPFSMLFLTWRPAFVVTAWVRFLPGRKFLSCSDVEINALNRFYSQGRKRIWCRTTNSTPLCVVGRKWYLRVSSLGTWSNWWKRSERQGLFLFGSKLFTCGVFDGLCCGRFVCWCGLTINASEWAFRFNLLLVIVLWSSGSVFEFRLYPPMLRCPREYMSRAAGLGQVRKLEFATKFLRKV